MSRAQSPSSAVKAVAGEDCEVRRLAGGDVAVALERNDAQSLVTIATDDALAVITVDEPGVDPADAIEAAYDVDRGIDRLLAAPFGGGSDA